MATSRTMVVVAGIMGLTIGTAHAVPITFTHAGSGIGTLGGMPFGLASFTITASGDTDARQLAEPGVFFIDHTMAQIDIEGLGTFLILTSTRTFANSRTDLGEPVPSVGFSRAGSGGGDLFNGPLAEHLFETWDMTTSIGPVVGSGHLYQWGLSAPPVETSGGMLIFDTQNTTATFTAVVAPAPGAIGLLTIAGIFASRRRRFIQRGR